MSALGQKAEVEQHPALVRFAPAPRTRASLKTVAMSVWCHDQTHAPRQTIALFNHLIDTTAEPDPHGFDPFGVAGSAKLTQSLDSVGD
jgi:hypothetical protein